MAQVFDFTRNIFALFFFSVGIFFHSAETAANNAPVQFRVKKANQQTRAQCRQLFRRARKNPNGRAARWLRKFEECKEFADRLDRIEAEQQQVEGQQNAQASEALSSGPTVVGNFGASALLRNDGTVLAWGFPAYGGNPNADIVWTTGQVETFDTQAAVGNQLKNVRALYATREAFAALRSNGTVVAWGSSAAGDTTNTANLSNVKTIISNDYAFAALRNDGTVFAWGEASHGGDASSVSGQLSGITRIYATEKAFVAIKSDGQGGNSVVVWGSGPVADSAAVQGLINVKAIYSNDHAAAALRNDGTVFAWGDSQNGGRVANVSNVKAIYSTAGAFAALRTDNSVITWGNGIWGGNQYDGLTPSTSLTDVKAIYANNFAFAALKNDDTVTTWGMGFAGGDSSGVALTNVETIVASDMAFAALKSDSTAVSWGTIQGTLANVEAIYATENAFAAVIFDANDLGTKNVATWDNRGQNNMMVQDVLAIFSTGYSFAALRVDDVVSWSSSNAIDHEVSLLPAQTVAIQSYSEGANLYYGAGNSVWITTDATTDANPRDGSANAITYTAEGVDSGGTTKASVCSIDGITGEVTVLANAVPTDICRVTTTFTASGYQDAAETVELRVRPAISFAQLNTRILTPYGCQNCHGSNGYAGQFAADQAAMNSYSASNSANTFLHASDPSVSELYKRVADDSMPVGGTALSDEDKEFVAAYIRGGSR